MMYEIKGIRYAGGLLRFLVSIAMAWLGCIALVSCDQGDTNAGEAEANITLTLCLKGADKNSNTRMGQPFVKPLASRGEKVRLKIRERRWKTVSTLANSTLFSMMQIIVWLESCKTWCSFMWAVVSTG